ncbi:MAG: coniferyl-alcohol dehydrogenase [Rhodospirillaceae bacterium]|jgi:NAD(P)-dependent dehydrogenase (short-subunit alcohol dehydrogenase family)|nr:coniferyl-alcohol dehydrogenase [Rhodospirillaceae bacterium]MBT5895782.1 coniferyl-alcohol dehydrogenase [Rhodospirillaceae bacterium]MBT6428549.1 coniferyl-alcohol dehydrogenase [Rhodospirillaceae bacterium]MBT7757457.1 coniferyl-alcohol dehydrogenase [Rhodospirillaceae bacterium]
MAMEHPVLLTGGASGVGEATAKLLLERGHKVVSIDIKPFSNDAVESHHCDLSDPASIDGVLAKLKGPYSSLLNVAGVPMAVGNELTMKVNYFGLRYLTERVFDRIADNGTVVNVASIAGNNWRKRRGYLMELMAIEDFDAGVAWWNENEGAVETDSYTFSKEAVVVYTMVLAGKGLARGIRVNDVGPGPVDTPILPDFTNDVGEENMQMLIDTIGRAAQPIDIAEALVALAEGQITWLNGQHIIVDGGLMAGISSGWKK